MRSVSDKTEREIGNKAACSIGLPEARSVLNKRERVTGNKAAWSTGLPEARSVFARTERETGNYHGSKHKKPGTLRHIGTPSGTSPERSRGR